MTPPRTDNDSTVVAELQQALRIALASLQQESGYSALRLSQALAMTIREAADNFARTRATITVQVVDENKATLAQLGHVLGVSKARAGQIVEHGRRLQIAANSEKSDITES